MTIRKWIQRAVASTIIGCASVSMAATASTGDLSKFSPAQQQQLQTYVNKAIPAALMKDPSMIIKAVQEFQMQQQQQKIDNAKHVILSRINDFLRNPKTPTQNPNGKVTLVEFFDYQCSVCHMMYPVINSVAKMNPNLRIVYKDLPIFGPASVYAAKGSFAAYQQSPALYLKYHDALFKSGKMEGKLTNKDVDAIAQKVGLNMTKFHAAINSQAVSEELHNSMSLAQSLQLTGTPAMIIAPSTATPGTALNKVVFIPGGARAIQLQKAITQVAQTSTANK